MWTTLALATVLNLVPARSDVLELKNARFTYGPFGQERNDTKVLGGDILYLRFDIEGLKVGDDGRAQYSMGLEVLNQDGKLQYKEDPQDQDGYAALGGDRIPAFTHVLVGTEQPKGEFEVKVTVKDRATEKSASFSLKFEVLPPQFGLVQVGMTYFIPDSDVQIPAPQSGAVGQRLLVNFSLVGFGLDKSRGDQPDVSAVMRVFDEDGNLTLNKPYSGAVKEVDPGYKKGVPLQFILQLNRPGKFTIVLKAIDELAGVSAQRTLHLTVTAPK
jgi:hypothetical protein